MDLLLSLLTVEFLALNRPRILKQEAVKWVLYCYNCLNIFLP